MAKIHYIVGDATSPQITEGEVSVICHCCNTIGAWGAGFVIPLGEKYPLAKLSYKSAIEMASKKREALLGEVNFVDCDENINIANIFGQSSIKLDKDGNPPINYNALENGFIKIINHYNKAGKEITIHMPRIGCGLAGGKWEVIEGLINQTFTKHDVEVFVYDLPSKTDTVSYRNIDKEIEKEIARYCDRHIYCGDIEFKRCKDPEIQKAGVDGYLSIPLLGINNEPTDEKAGAHYVNSPIKTYLMELSQITKAGKEVDGWFLSENSKTEYYILMYLWAQVPQYEKDGKMVSEWQKIREDNITMLEYYIVKKSDIYEYLQKCGFDKQRLRKAVKYLRTHPDTNKVQTNHGFKFVISRGFKECPVNICIEKRVYNKICKLHRYVGKYDYEKLIDYDTIMH